MSLSTVQSSDSQNIGSLVLQSLLGQSSSTDGSGTSGILGDLLDLSSTSQQLSQAPADVTSAMTDLFSAQSNVSGDLSTLSSYFKQNPSSLTSVLAALQGGSSTYDASGNVAGSSLAAALAKAQAGGADTTALLTGVLGGQNGNLFSAMSNSSSTTSALSMFG